MRSLTLTSTFVFYGLSYGLHMHQVPPLPRRHLLGALCISACLVVSPAAQAKDDKQPRVRRLSLEEAREVGEARAAKLDREKGPVFTVKGIKLREEVQGQGAPIREGDVGYIQYSVFRINGDLMFALGKGAELQRDEGEQYRMVLGGGQVPKAVELGMAGMREGGRRRIVVPPALGWDTSGGLPAPTTFSGKRKLELYRAQPLMMEVDLQRVVPKRKLE